MVIWVADKVDFKARILLRWWTDKEIRPSGTYSNSKFVYTQ
jgi:hypothetical protein